MQWLERLKRLIPSHDQLHNNRWLKIFGPRLRHPRLWHWSRRGVALGVGIGIFFGLLVPVAQIPLSAAAAVLLRANLPAAAASTLVTNPVTFGPVYYLAYRVGAWTLGQEMPQALPATASTTPDPPLSLMQRLRSVGKPLLLGLAILATAAGLLSYAAVSLVWRWRVGAKRRKGRRKPAPASCAAAQDEPPTGA